MENRNGILSSNTTSIPENRFLMKKGIWYWEKNVIWTVWTVIHSLFASECQELNSYYHKNKNFNEIKSHHYIISFDPKDRDECGLTGERAQQLGLTFAKKNFPGHQALVCTHTDGHNESGNIHVHIVINSLRKYDIPQEPYMEFDCEAKAGYKHHLSTAYLIHLKQEVMDM